MSPAQIWSVKMAESVMARRPLLHKTWHYETGVILSALQQVYLATGNTRCFDYIKYNMDYFIKPDGSIETYDLVEYNLDQINQGKSLFWLYRQTENPAYRNAAFLLRRQLQTQPRTTEGGFWHKLKYPHQLWLDGVYMTGPFLAEFAQTFNEPAIFDDVARHMLLVAARTRDEKTGLMFHAWDESRNQIWANPRSGCSPNFWGRAFGWYTMALVDVLDFLPGEHPRREEIIGVLARAVQAWAAVQHTTGLWFQVLNRPDLPGNYLEASASCMAVYAIAKGVRRGYLPAPTLAIAQKAYRGILKHFVDVDCHGLAHLHWICSVAGLDRYRDGSVEYYLKENVVTDDYKGVGPFIMAATELETLELRPRNETITAKTKGA